MKVDVLMLSILFTLLSATIVTSQNVPASPSITSMSAGNTSIYMEWTQSFDIEVDSFTIKYTYTFKDCDDVSQIVYSGNVTDIDNTTTSYNLTNLEEHSDYDISLIAVNQDGASNPATFSIATRQTRPSSIVSNLTAVAVTPTTITITWNRTPCRDRNSRINLYVAIWYPYRFEDQDDPRAVALGEPMNFNEHQFQGLLPRTTYYVSIRADRQSVNEFVVGIRAVLNVTTATPESVGFFLNGRLYPNNSALPASQIRSGSRALLCVTDLQACCSSDETGSGSLGNWILPSGSMAPDSGSGLTVSRAPSSVSLNRVSGTAPTGVYTCEIPDANNTNRVLHFYAYSGQAPDLPVVSGLFFNATGRAMVCLSIGQLVDSVTWLKDGVEVKDNSSGFTQSQRIVNRLEVIYEHLLKIDADNILGTFTCRLRNADGRHAERSLTLNGVNLVHSLLPLEVGQDETLTCVSETGIADKIEWSVNGTILVNAASVDTLDLSFTPVNDSLDIHQRDFVCSVFKSGQIFKQTLPVTVAVPEPAFNVSIVSTSGSLAAGSEYNMTCQIRKLYSGLTGSPQLFWTSFVENRFFANGTSVNIGENDSTAEVTWNPVYTGATGRYVCVAYLHIPILVTNLTYRLEVDLKFQFAAPDVNILKSEFTTTNGQSSVVLSCMASVNRMYLTFGRAEYEFTWLRNGNVLQRGEVLTEHNEARSFEYTLNSPGVFSDNFTCSVIAADYLNQLFRSTAASDTREVTRTVAESCLNATYLVDPDDGDGGNLTCSIEVCPYLGSILIDSAIVVTWKRDGETIHMEHSKAITSNKFQSVLVEDFIEANVNYSCEATAPYSFNGPSSVSLLTTEVSFIPATGLYIHFCVEDYTDSIFLDADTMAFMEKVVEFLSNCSSDFSDMNLRNGMLEFNNKTRRSLIFEAHLLGVRDMSSAELRECVLEKIYPRVLINNTSLELVCNTTCTSSDVCIIETTSAPDLTTATSEATEQVPASTSSLGTTDMSTTSRLDSTDDSDQDASGGVPLYVIIIIVVVVIVILAILLVALLIFVVYKCNHTPEKISVVAASPNKEYVNLHENMHAEKNNIINSSDEVTTFTGSQEKSKSPEKKEHSN